jgi:nitroreductase
MLHNTIIDTMLNHKSVRKYTDETPSDEIIQTVVRAGMQAAFAAQVYSVLLRRNIKGIAWGAPLEFFICADSHKLETIMARRNWTMVSNDLSMLLYAIQDAILMAQNMALAAESLGLGTCFIGSAPYIADRIIKEFSLPPRVFPIVSMVMGFPAEDPPPRPRYPIDFVLFEHKYPEFTEEQISRAMKEMDDGYLAQDYYDKGKFRVGLEDGRKDTFPDDKYSWTEHISRKWGQWHKSHRQILNQLAACGFSIPSSESGNEGD